LLRAKSPRNDDNKKTITIKPWLNISSTSDFSIHNLPYGVFSLNGKDKHIGVAIGDFIIDMHTADVLGLFDDLDLKDTLLSDTLNRFISLGKPTTNKVRLLLQKELCTDGSLKKHADKLLIKQTDVQMHVPIVIGDYTDFYSSKEHATNVGAIFRDKENALPPNWLHLPIAYHGRASSIKISGTPIHRPQGQIMTSDKGPILAPTKSLDFELEMAFVIGKETNSGEHIPVDKAEEYIFGMLLFNDWSARDIQRWEYQPLGPFLAKNFASTISPWIVTMEALEPFRTKSPEQNKVLDYLKDNRNSTFDIQLQAILKIDGQEFIITKSNFKYLYWSMAQQLAHHTINGCNVNVGDVMASGTISGAGEHAKGCLLEITEGKKKLELSSTTSRMFLEDGDELILKAFAEKDTVRVGFGAASGKIIA
jgi:fumarylacetoacetase